MPDQVARAILALDRHRVLEVENDDIRAAGGSLVEPVGAVARDEQEAPRACDHSLPSVLMFRQGVLHTNISSPILAGYARRFLTYCAKLGFRRWKLTSLVQYGARVASERAG